MKKILSLAVVAMMAFTANAQETYYGAQKGGFAITFNANPALNYIGNMFNGTQNNTLENFKGLNDGLFDGTTITGKYFLEDNLAVVGGFGFGNVYNTTFRYFDAEDVEKETSYDKAATTKFMVKAGLEYRLKPGQRLQPLFGADLVYVHNNPYTFTKQEEGGDTETYQGAPANKLGLMLSAGVEYFIIPQMSVGATVDFGLAKTWNGQSYDSTVDGATNFYRIENTETQLETGNFGGNISLNFYF